MELFTEYIKNDHKGFTFGDEFKQHFFSKSARQVNAPTLLQQRQSGYITDLDIEVIKFINDFKFVTVEILQVFLGDEFTLKQSEQYLEKLCRTRYLSKFMLESITRDDYPSDALDIYCLDTGGNILLQNYDKPNNEITFWYSAMNLKSAAQISYFLSAAMFYANLRKNCKDKILYYKLAPVYKLGKNSVSPTLELCIENHGEKKYFVCEVIRKYDVPIELRTKVTNIETIIGTNAWKKYFYGVDKPPMLLLINEDDDTAKTAAVILNTAATEIKECRYTTVERCCQDMSLPGVLLKYDKDKGGLVKMRTDIFSSKPEPPAAA